MFVNGVLVLYHHYLAPNANTIIEHIEAFERYSSFKVWSVNTKLGFPQPLRELQFQSIVLHYSLFGSWPYLLGEAFLNYLKQSQASYKVAFFQDEHHFCRERFDFINQYKIDCVYTLVEPAYFKATYEKYTSVSKLVHHIPGYVSDRLVDIARQETLPDEERKIDIGYRGRKLKYYMGKGGQEKYEIAVRFLERATGLGLKLDIEAEEQKRIYGETWYRFLANCRACLGVEAGVSIFDIEDLVRTEYERLVALNPNISFEQVSKKMLHKWEDNIPYRTISPRHFEAATLRVCQILYEGKYSGILQPYIHYIPLKKDFSNFEDVIQMFRDPALRRELTENAHRDLIASGRYSYRRFIRECFDQTLLECGLRPEISPEKVARVTSLVNKGAGRRQFHALVRKAWYHPFPGRFMLVPLVKMVRAYRRLKKEI
ncbi:hypothetical protein KAX17_15575 [Candidatus Bipolaricaulota bacterium]|nr:hypothetical protein [Candidatus Bipolaricaulota bacterium]